MNTIGAVIKRLRIESGMSQTEFIKKTGISNQASLSNIENGHKIPKEKTLRNMCKALNISFGWLHVLAIGDST